MVGICRWHALKITLIAESAKENPLRIRRDLKLTVNLYNQGLVWVSEGKSWERSKGKSTISLDSKLDDRTEGADGVAGGRLWERGT